MKPAAYDASLRRSRDASSRSSSSSVSASNWLSALSSRSAWLRSPGSLENRQLAAQRRMRRSPHCGEERIVILRSGQRCQRRRGTSLLERELLRANTVGIDLLNSGLSHDTPTLATSPIRQIVGASSTRRAKLERSANRRRNSSRASTVRSTVRPAALPTGRTSRRNSRRSASPITRTSMSLSGRRVPPAHEP